MTRDELAQQVAAIQKRHADAADPKIGDGVGLPPTPDEVAVLTLDKCVATADGLGIVSQPDDWKPFLPGVFRFDDGPVSYVFDDGIVEIPEGPDALSSGLRVVAPAASHVESPAVASEADVAEKIAEITQTGG